VPLGDGNQASVGDLIITRSNDRRLRTSPTDWVKNGDRWSIVRLQPSGALTVQHARNGRLLHLPADYVATAVELGYASTIHTAQGLTADTGHTLLTGEESRQLAYTAATRGRMENHLYLEVVGDGDVHNVGAPRPCPPPHRHRSPRTHPGSRRLPPIGNHDCAGGRRPGNACSAMPPPDI